MLGAPLPIITDDLRIMLGDTVATLTPTQGLHLAEQLARKSFRRALTEEACLDGLRHAATPARKRRAATDRAA